MVTVTDARADLNLSQLCPDDQVAAAPTERKRRALSRVRAVATLLPPSPPLASGPGTSPLAGGMLASVVGKLRASKAALIEGLGMAAVIAIWATLAASPTGPRAASASGRADEPAGAAVQGSARTVDRPPIRRVIGRTPTFLSVMPTPAPRPDAAAPAVEAGALHEGLLGYWRFDDGPGSASARDLSGHSNDCLLRGLDQPSAAHFVNGPLGGALALPGRAWLECPRTDPVARLSNELTVALWIKRTGQETHVRALVSRQFAQDGRDHFHLGFRNEKLWLRTVVKGTAAGSRIKLLRGRWYHVAGTVEIDGTARVFVDGEEVGSKRAAGRPGLGGGRNPLLIGAGFNRPDSFISERLRGVIDELVIYDRALAPEEIRALARGAQPPALRVNDAGARD